MSEVRGFSSSSAHVLAIWAWEGFGGGHFGAAGAWLDFRLHLLGLGFSRLLFLPWGPAPAFACGFCAPLG